MNRWNRLPCWIACAALLALMLTAGFSLAGNTGNMNRAVANEATNNGAPALGKPSDFIFIGCWTYFPAGPCHDIYRDSEDNYWICQECLQTKNPGSKKCQPISEETLNNGYWCL
jgi:hypothetical protein